MKRIVADMSEQNDNHIGSYEIDPKYSDFIGKYTLILVSKCNFMYDYERGGSRKKISIDGTL